MNFFGFGAEEVVPEVDADQGYEKYLAMTSVAFGLAVLGYVLAQKSFLGGFFGSALDSTLSYFDQKDSDEKEDEEDSEFEDVLTESEYEGEEEDSDSDYVDDGKDDGRSIEVGSRGDRKAGKSGDGSQGKKKHKALLIGINYTRDPDKQMRLRGCVNDAVRLARFLYQKGDQNTEIRLLCDDAVDVQKIVGKGSGSTGSGPKVTVVQGGPTAQNIIAELGVLIQKADADTALWFSYSGHGTYVKDTSGDESDGKDEALVPLDHQRAGYITDDWLRANVINKLPAKTRLTCLVDACHSGTAFDLHVSLEDFSATKLKKLPLEYRRSDWQIIQRRSVHKNNKECVADVVMISGCRDNQTSADAWEDSQSVGAMTHAFLKFFDSCHDAVQLLQDMSCWLKLRKYTQRPLLSFGSVATERANEHHLQLL